MVRCEDLTVAQSAEGDKVVYEVTIDGIFPAQFNNSAIQKIFVRSLNAVVSKIPGDQPVDVRIDFSRVTFAERGEKEPVELSAISIFFSETLKTLVHFPDEVDVQWGRGELANEIIFTVSPVDLGAVSGAGGSYILALRRLMEAFGYRTGKVLLIGSPKDTSGVAYSV